MPLLFIPRSPRRPLFFLLLWCDAQAAAPQLLSKKNPSPVLQSIPHFFSPSFLASGLDMRARIDEKKLCSWESLGGRTGLAMRVTGSGSWLKNVKWIFSVVSTVYIICNNWRQMNPSRRINVRRDYTSIAGIAEKSTVHPPNERFKRDARGEYLFGDELERHLTDQITDQHQFALEWDLS